MATQASLPVKEPHFTRIDGSLNQHPNLTVA